MGFSVLIIDSDHLSLYYSQKRHTAIIIPLIYRFHEKDEDEEDTTKK